MSDEPDAQVIMVRKYTCFAVLHLEACPFMPSFHGICLERPTAESALVWHPHPDMLPLMSGHLAIYPRRSGIYTSCRNDFHPPNSNIPRAQDCMRSVLEGFLYPSQRVIAA
jgi:hypothetical protein